MPWTEALQRDGFVVIPELLYPEQMADVAGLIESLQPAGTGTWRGGARDILHSLPELWWITEHPRVRSLLNVVLGRDAFVVRATLFDKTPEANWKVPWHQDVTIAVKERKDVSGYGPWSMKDGIPHVQPPAHVLRRTLTVRIHVDPCPAENGALRVMPGTQSLGRLDQNRVAPFVDEQAAVTCECGIGDALLM